MKTIFTILWFPHSGCRWLNRSFLKNHQEISNFELCLPWLTHTTDRVLNLDRTAQVHKARSNANLKSEFEILIESTAHGRREGVRKYFELLVKASDPSTKVLGGPLSPGSPEPLIPDLDNLNSIGFKLKVIHLVRHPVQCFASMKSRNELDGNPFVISTSWTSFNSYIRSYKINMEYKLIKYEELLEDLEFNLKGICEFLEIGYKPEMLDSDQLYYGLNRGNDISKLVTSTEYDIIRELSGSESENYNYSF